MNITLQGVLMVGRLDPDMMRSCSYLDVTATMLLKVGTELAPFRTTQATSIPEIEPTFDDGDYSTSATSSSDLKGNTRGPKSVSKKASSEKTKKQKQHK
jgi:hypothetical protein